MFEQELKKLENSITPPWERLGVDVEFYIKDLTVRWGSINAILKSGTGDTSIVNSTITETLEFLVWAQSKKELQSAVALIKQQLKRIEGHNDNTRITERFNKRINL